MKLIIFCALVVAASAIGYDHDHDHDFDYAPSKYNTHTSYHHVAPKHFAGKAVVKGDIIFEGCVEQSCTQDHFQGYGCHGGHCATICEPKGCYENKSFKRASSQKWGEEEAYGKRYQKGGEKGQSQYKGHVQFGGKVEFSGCSSEHCSNGEQEGYNCKDGHCATVCQGEECHEEKQIGYGY